MAFALSLICATALSAEFTNTVYPFPSTIGISQTSEYTLSTLFGDETKSFTFAIKSMSSCPSTVDLTVVYPWRPVGQQTVTYTKVGVGKPLVESTKFVPSSLSAARTATVVLSTISTSCRITLDDGAQVYDNDVLEDAASLAIGILLAIIIGSIVCCICVIVCIVYMCRKNSSTTTIIQQPPAQQYQPMAVNDGYNYNK
eukprot:TRINITY_DN670_c0_g1_i6.p1 TRINITY_DN670_c0_g1~~TRINITY_DN670_c0_g1_i6.p1  ORF type:complete len:199 (+),score=18.31 TRINITY_DN670_c0_g1_i6:79-675(+)